MSQKPTLQLKIQSLGFELTDFNKDITCTYLVISYGDQKYVTTNSQLIDKSFLWKDININFYQVIDETEINFQLWSYDFDIFNQKGFLGESTIYLQQLSPVGSISYIIPFQSNGYEFGNLIFTFSYQRLVQIHSTFSQCLQLLQEPQYKSNIMGQNSDRKTSSTQLSDDKNINNNENNSNFQQQAFQQFSPSGKIVKVISPSMRPTVVSPSRHIIIAQPVPTFL